MILYEFEGKKLLAGLGIRVPESNLVTKLSQWVSIMLPVVLKAQVLSGKRAVSGGIVVAKDETLVHDALKALFAKTINNEKVDKVLVEEKVDFEKEYYVSISYDTNSRGPVLTISKSGGTGIEDKEVETFALDPLNPARTLGKLSIDKEVLEKLVSAFFDLDCILLEINPLVQDKNKNWIALDAKVELDDSALARHEDFMFPPRSPGGYTPSEREIEAKKIDEGDYRGVAGSSYFDLDGDIAVLASGGGASLTAMDALLRAGGKPANYTEYSGNPPKEKVEKLTRIVLSKPGLNGLWVGGAVANFTDIYETLSGFIEALRKVKYKPKYPIVIRRGGPRDKEAFAMLKRQKDFDLHLFGGETSIAESAKKMVALSKKYASTK